MNMARLGPLLHNLSQAAIKTSGSGEVSPKGLTGEGFFSLFTYFASFSPSRAVGLMASTPHALLQATLSGLLQHGTLLLFFPWDLDGRIISWGCNVWESGEDFNKHIRLALSKPYPCETPIIMYMFKYME